MIDTNQSLNKTTNKNNVIIMSETTTETVTPDVNLAEDHVLIETREGVKYVKHSFEGDELGRFGWAVPEFDDLPQMIKHFEGILKNESKDLSAEDLIVDLVQNSIDAKLRIKVRNELPKPEVLKTLPDNHLFFDVDKASKWIPGVRELRGKKKVISLAEQIKEAHLAGDTNKVNALMLQLIQAA